MICSHCSVEIPDVSAFCPACGGPVSAPGTLTAQGTRDAVLGGLAYVTVVPAILFLAFPSLKSSRFVRFHSWQSLFFAVAVVLAAVLVKFLFAILSILPMIGFLAAWLSIGVTFIAVSVLWVVLPLKALQGQSYELPVLGSIAARLIE
jgi:uncharacterized membrane protein